MRVYFDIPSKSSRGTADRQVLRFLANINGWFTAETASEAEARVRIGNPADQPAPHSLTISRDAVARMAAALCDAAGPSAAAPHPDAATPWIDRMALDLREQWLKTAATRHTVLVRKLPWPKAKPFAVAMTHDVDLTRRYGPLDLLRRMLKGDARYFGTGIRRLLRGQNDYWTFPELLELYARQGWRATFFFLARATEGRGYRYDIRHTKFRRLFDDLLKGGHEIGLHTSRYAQRHPRRIAAEKKRLERVSGVRAVGVRQHYLNLTFPDGWQKFAAAGFEYDSSCGFNEVPGFRAGTAFPFPAFSADCGSELPLHEIPFSVMDYAWRKDSPDAAAARKRFRQITEAVRATGGLLNVLWHPSNLAEADFRPLWEQLISWLQNADCHQDTLTGILDWWRAREQVALRRVTAGETEIQLVLHSPRDVAGLVLEIRAPGHWRLSAGPGRLTAIDNGVYRLALDILPAGDIKVRLTAQT